MSTLSALAPRVGKVIYFVLTGLIVVYPAFMNNYPLVYSDTGTYIISSRDLVPPVDRPLMYGWLIRILSWQVTLWPVVMFQGALGSWLIYRVLRVFFRLEDIRRLHVAALIMLTAMSGIGWYASQIMPDILSGYLALVVFLLLFAKLDRRRSVFLWILGIVLTTTHLSFIPMMLLVVLFGTLFPSVFLPGSPTRELRRRFAMLLLIPLASGTIICTQNSYADRGFVLSPVTKLFLAAKLGEAGILHDYLKQKCETMHDPLCPHKEKLNTSAMGLIWQEDSPLRNSSSLIVDADSASRYVNAILGDPQFYPALLGNALSSTLIQLAQLEVGSGIVSYGEHNPANYIIRMKMPHEYGYFKGSIQQKGLWNFGRLNQYLFPIYIFCIGLLVLLLLRGESNIWRALIITVFAFLIANAASTGVLANVYDRLQARITWLVVFAALMFAFRYLRDNKHFQKFFFG